MTRYRYTQSRPRILPRWLTESIAAVGLVVFTLVVLLFGLTL